MWTFALCVIAISRLVSSQSTPIPVLGVQTGIVPNTTQRQARLNINDLYIRGGPQWDLYVQALQALQDVDETDELSYFQISGIHGYPVQPWNGVENVPGGPGLGYCPHSEILFASWHRPFVALFEQELVKHAVRIASRYPQRVLPSYQAAAQTLRQPYWDWAADHSLPPAAIVPTLKINTPAGADWVRNPLYSYRFQKLPTGNGFSGNLTKFSVTLRCPGGYDGATPDPELANYNLNSSSLNLMSQVYQVFIKSDTYDRMASISSPGPSFEAPHNIIHQIAGCTNGTLYNIGWSAFDPLFMLHHSKVDRLIAMWQAIHYNASTPNTTDVAHGTFGTADGTPIDADSPLKPFFDARLDLYTARSAAATSTFGYTYPEIRDWEARSADELAARVRRAVNELYGKTPGNGTPRPSSSSSRPNQETTATADEGLVEYSAEIRVDRADVPLPCAVDLRLAGHVLGTVALLGMPTTGVSYATVPLREALGRLNLAAMGEDTLVPYLQRNLEVEVRSGDGVVPWKCGETPSVVVELQVQDFVPRTSDTDFPRFGGARRWVVANRHGG